MGFQSSINQTLNTAGIGLALSKEVESKNLDRKLQTMQAESDLAHANTALSNLTNDLVAKNMIKTNVPENATNEEKNAIFDKAIEKNQASRKQDIGKELTDINMDDDARDSALQEGRITKEENSQWSQDIKNRLQKAATANSDLNDEILARKTLKFDINSAKAKLAILKKGGNK